MATPYLTPVQILALSKAIDKGNYADARELVSTGDYSGTVTLILDYEMSVNKDSEVAGRIAWRTLAIMLANLLNDACLEVVVKSYLAKDKAGEKGRVTDKLLTPILDALPRADRKGAVKVDADTRVIEVTEAAPGWFITS